MYIYIYIGFKVHGIINLLRQHPVNFMLLLTPSDATKLTTDRLETLFVPQFHLKVQTNDTLKWPYS